MKKRLFFYGLVALAAVAFISGCSKDKEPTPPEPSLTLDRGTDPVSFTAEATESFAYVVTTNQPSWDAVSDQTWCIVTKNGKGFTLTATENTALIPPPSATVTVTAGTAPSIALKVTQAAAGAVLAISPEPENNEVNFTAAGGDETYTVTTNLPSWDVASDKEDWCKVAKTDDGTGFTVTVAPNRSADPMPDAKVTVSADGAQSVVLTVKQAGVDAALIFDDDTRAAAAYGKGDGTESSPYEISTAAELKKLVDEDMSQTAGVCYRLMADLKIAASEWKPIGVNSIYPFLGDFDGNGHTVFGQIVSSTTLNCGFFGALSGNAVVRNLTVDAVVENNYKNSVAYTAAIASYIVGGTSAEPNHVKILNCQAKGSVKGASTTSSSYIRLYAAGIVGAIWNDNAGSIEGCTNYASVTGGRGESTGSYVDNRVGGIVGYITGANSTVTVSECSNYGPVTGGSVVASSSSSNVHTGGIIGGISTAKGVLIHLCRNFDAVTSGEGQSDGGSVSICTGAVCGAGNVFSCCSNAGTVDGVGAPDARLVIGTVVNCPDDHTVQ